MLALQLEQTYLRIRIRVVQQHKHLALLFTLLKLKYAVYVSQRRQEYEQSQLSQKY